MPTPRSVTDWYDEAIAVLQEYKERIERMKAPVVQDDLTQVLALCKQIVAIKETPAKP